MGGFGTKLHHLSTMRSVLADKSTPSEAYLAANAYCGLFGASDACHSLPIAHQYPSIWSH
eukprot:6200146-Pleurochrysis_carterae.AAC.3